MTHKNSLITGISDLLVLSILNEKGDCYAYEIAKYITTYSDELLTISHNTIYTVMYKLEKEQMISEYSKLVGKKRTRVYYHIEESGKAYLDKLTSDYKQITDGLERILLSFTKEERNNE